MKTRGSAVRSRRASQVPIAALTILSLFVISALLADFISPHSPIAQDIGRRLLPPVWMGGTADHILGTDILGRDLLARILHGGRISLSVAAMTLFFGGGLGLILGIVAGYRGGWVDSLIMRFNDAALAIPAIFLAIVFAVIAGPSYLTVVVALSALVWSRFTRVVRADTIRVIAQDYVMLGRSAGLGTARLLIRHVLPNVMPTWIVLLGLELGAVIVTESMLSFIGAGIPPPAPSWGGLIADGRTLISTHWWLTAFPGVAITAVVLAVNVVGDWIRDVLDPQSALQT